MKDKNYKPKPATEEALESFARVSTQPKGTGMKAIELLDKLQQYLNENQGMTDVEYDNFFREDMEDILVEAEKF